MEHRLFFWPAAILKVVKIHGTEKSRLRSSCSEQVATSPVEGAWLVHKLMQLLQARHQTSAHLGTRLETLALASYY